MAKMEQFKKWWMNHNEEGHPDSAGFQFDSEVWKAALEWALEQDTWIGSDENGEWGIDKDEIKGELRGEES